MAEQSLTDIAYAYIKERIIDLTWPPGSFLTEAALAEELEMSRMPVRTAVKQLQQEGLILGEYRKKMRVKEITEDDIREIYQIRALLEGGALQLIFDTSQAQQYSFRIEEKLIRMRSVASDYFKWEQADADMHMEFLKVYENDRMFRIYQMNQDEMLRIGILSSGTKCEVDAINAEIARLAEALREEDHEAAHRILIDEHLGRSRERALEKIERRE